MLINIKMMTEEAYKTLQKNYKEVFDNIINHPSDASWLESFLGFEPYEEKKYTIEDFELDDNNDYSIVAYKNGVILYEHLKDLPRYVLCSNRFWAWITFEKAYKQAQHSIKLSNCNIVKNFWLSSNSRRSIMLGVISRSFYKVEVSVDNSNKDNIYCLTNYLYNGPASMDTYRALVYRNIGMLKQASIAFLKTLYSISKQYGEEHISKDLVYETMKDTSKIGSVMLVDAMKEDEIYQLLMEKAKKKF